MKNILVTGGNGFIGSNLIRQFLDKKEFNLIINIDKNSKQSIDDKFLKIKSKRYIKIKDNLSSSRKLLNCLNKYKINYILHLAAETHVDRSITSPSIFIKSNIDPTVALLEAFSKYHRLNKNRDLRFIYFSTDEVFGSVNKGEKRFNINSKLNPSSPYSSSKAASGLIIQSWRKTYNLPLGIVYCCNNYGPFQNSEKLIPATIFRAINEMPILVYGKGEQIRTWIHVNDTVSGIYKILKNKKYDADYFITSKNVLKNIDCINMMCKYLDRFTDKKNTNRLIKFTEDRPAHDAAYLMDDDENLKRLGWKEDIEFGEGIFKTIEWYLINMNYFFDTKKTFKSLLKVGFK